MCNSDDPTDIIFFVLDLLTKCCPGVMKKSLKVTRALMTYCIDAAFVCYVYIYMIESLFSEEVSRSPWPWLIYSIIIVIVICILSYQGIYTVADKMKWTTFYFTYKAIDLFFAIADTVGIILIREELDFQMWVDNWREYWKEIALVVITGLDVVLNPIEIIAGICKLRCSELQVRNRGL